ncbi:MAG: cytosol nonspecific dipeptidase, partial [Candidatus Thermoplasmatota archaeon]|nr:cytosol nonspecific dipeptidase [Candidatus Thermoplasmatota archaeon]
MASIVEGFEPKNVWKYFEEITRIPRPSKHEEKILQYLKDFASERNLEMREDSTGNIVVIRPGSNGGENAPTIVIQSHVDMVCEKNRDS